MRLRCPRPSYFLDHLQSTTSTDCTDQVQRIWRVTPYSPPSSECFNDILVTLGDFPAEEDTLLSIEFFKREIELFKEPIEIVPQKGAPLDIPLSNALDSNQNGVQLNVLTPETALAPPSRIRLDERLKGLLHHRLWRERQNWCTPAPKWFRVTFRQDSPSEETSWASSNLFQAFQTLRPAGGWLDLDIWPVWHCQNPYVFDLLIQSKASVEATSLANVASSAATVLRSSMNKNIDPSVDHGLKTAQKLFGEELSPYVLGADQAALATARTFSRGLCKSKRRFSNCLWHHVKAFAQSRSIPQPPSSQARSQVAQACTTLVPLLHAYWAPLGQGSAGLHAVSQVRKSTDATEMGLF